MMFWVLFRYFVFAVFVALAFYYTVKHKHLALLCLYFWAIGFANCFVFYLTIWTPAKIVSLFMIWCILFHKKERPPEHETLYSVFFSFYVALVVLGNFVALFSQASVLVLEGNPLSRLLLQDFSYLTAGVLLFYGTLLKKGFAPRLYKAYCIAAETAICIAMVHLFCNAIGIHFMPINRAVEHNDSLVDTSLSVKAMFGGERVLRVYGFAGEPKNLGFYIVPYLLMSIVAFLNDKIRLSKPYHIIMFLTGLFILLETYSSSAIITFVITLPFLLVYFLKGMSKKSLMILLGAVVLASPIAFRGMLSSGGDDSDTEFAKAMFERTFQRGYKELSHGRQEVDIIETYLEGGPLQLLFGWGIGQYTFHVEDSFTDDGALKTVQSGIVLAIADFGIPGIILYILLAIIVFKTLRYSHRHPGIWLKLYAIACMSSFLGSLMYGSIFTCFVYLMICHYIRIIPSKKKIDNAHTACDNEPGCVEGGTVA